MQISPNGLYRIKWEECNKDAEGNIICPLQAYAATPDEASNNIYTIGYGNTSYLDGKPVKRGDKITQDQAEALFASKIADFESKLAPMLTMQLTQSQYDAIVSFVYNIGLTAFANSTMLKDLHVGNYTKAGNDMMMFDEQNHKVLQDLIDRRTRERTLYFSNDTPDLVQATLDNEEST